MRSKDLSSIYHGLAYVLCLFGELVHTLFRVYRRARRNQSAGQCQLSPCQLRTVAGRGPPAGLAEGLLEGREMATAQR